MAEEAKIKVRLDTGDAERGVQRIDTGFKKATSSAGKFAAVTARSLGGVVGAVVGLASAGTPGAINASATFGGALAREASSSVATFLGLPGLGQGAINAVNALDEQRNLTANAIGPLAAGAISESRLNEVFDAMKPLADLQVKGEQRLKELVSIKAVVGAAIGAGATAQQIVDFGKKVEDIIDAITEGFRRVTGGD